ncbi:MAG: hypothetical protein JKY09_03530 [Crocinitomicaceae bacterium]|nr:hypothetical protein [Crocinitomicaceae bacterium]
MKKEAAIVPRSQDGQTPIVFQQTKKQSWYSSLTPEQKKLVSSIAIALGISLVAVGAIFFATKFVRNKVSNVEENKSLGQDKHATWAKQIKNAFNNNGWWGTDEVLLRNTLREIPSKEDFKKVQSSYRKLFKGANLVTDMTGELKQTEYDEMLAIINAKPNKARDVKNGVSIYDPHGWAKRIYSALSYNWLGLFWGTDEDAIKAVFIEMPTHKAYWDTKKVYRSKYGTDMKKDMQADMDDLNTYLKIIWRKPKS